MGLKMIESPSVSGSIPIGLMHLQQGRMAIGVEPEDIRGMVFLAVLNGYVRLDGWFMSWQNIMFPSKWLVRPLADGEEIRLAQDP